MRGRVKGRGFAFAKAGSCIVLFGFGGGMMGEL